jgi:hypothetical protein
MSLSVSNLNHSLPLLSSSAAIHGLTAEVSRGASQSQVVVQNSTAYSGAQSNNAIQETATLFQGANADNSKHVQVNPTATAGVSAYSPIASLAAGIGVPNSDFLSLGRAAVDQNQLVAQNAFARLQNVDGQPSRASNGLAQAASTGTEISSNLGQGTALGGSAASSQALRLESRQAVLNPLFPMEQVLPLDDFRLSSSVKAEQNRLASSASLLLGRQQDANLTSLNLPTPIRSTPMNPTPTTSSAGSNSLQTGVSAPVPTPAQLLATGPHPVDPSNRVSPPPPSLTRVNGVV